VRTFIGIALKEEVKQTVFEIQQQCRQMCKKGNFTEKDNFHMTLHFVGETRAEEIEDLKQAIYETAIRNKTFTLILKQLGVFERGQTGVLWVGVEKSIALEHLFEGLQRSLSKQGFAREKKKLSPHITLARQAVPYHSFAQMQKSLLVEQKEILVDCITLFESVRIGTKLIYRPLFTEEFQKKKI
jgi:2'-5' RNA ligase